MNTHRHRNRHWRQWNWPFWAASGLLLAASVATIAIPSWYAYHDEPVSSRRLDRGASSTPSEHPVDLRRLAALAEARERAIDVIAAGFLFAVGGCIGSFLNVVIYRLPRGQTILGHSMCPYCRTRIRPSDNVPIFAWLRLRGRCRVCRLPIAPRYMWVELTVALMFLLLGIWELGTWGYNLPHVARPHHGGFAWAVLLPNVHYALVYLAHVSLLTTLIAATLIRTDRQHVPWQLWGFTWFMILVAHLGSSAMHPIPWHGTLTHDRHLSYPSFDVRWPVDGLVGVAAGLAIATCLMSLPSIAFPPSLSRTIFGSIGWCVGWQGLLLTWCWSCLLRLPPSSARQGNWAPSGARAMGLWTVALLLHLCTWRWSHSWVWQALPEPIMAVITSLTCFAIEWLIEMQTPHGDLPSAPNCPNTPELEPITVDSQRTP